MDINYKKLVDGTGPGSRTVLEFNIDGVMFGYFVGFSVLLHLK
jgi:hypothetical protein